MAHFSTTGLPTALASLETNRFFKVGIGAQATWFELQRDNQHANDLLTVGHLVYTGRISRFARSKIKPTDFPINVERRLADADIRCTITLPHVLDRWGSSLTAKGVFRIAFRDPHSRDRYFNRGERIPLLLTDVAGLGKIDLDEGVIEAELGPLRVKWMWFSQASALSDVKEYMRERFGENGFAGIRRTKPKTAVYYTVGFDSRSDLMAFTRAHHDRMAPSHLIPVSRNTQTVCMDYTTPRYACFKCYHPDFVDEAKTHKASECVTKVCRVCFHRDHDVTQCGFVERQERIIHREADDYRAVTPTAPRRSSETSSVRSNVSARSWRVGPRDQRTFRTPGRPRQERKSSPG